MSTCVKIWSCDETEPPDGSSHNLTTAPKNWFREPMALALELYALERWSGTNQDNVIVFTLDDLGHRATHRVSTTTYQETMVKIRKEGD